MLWAAKRGLMLAKPGEALHAKKQKIMGGCYWVDSADDAGAISGAKCLQRLRPK